MPNLDRTGPWGLGPMTGRGLGRCARGYGRGHGYGRGFGYGLGAHGRWKGRYYYPQVSSLREDKAFRRTEGVFKRRTKLYRKDIKRDRSY